MRMKINKNLLFLIMIVITETILVKMFMYRFLPEKFFYDSNGILQLLNSTNIPDMSRKFTVMFFSKINIFGFTTVQQWGIMLSLIFSILIIKKIIKNKYYSTIQMLFIIMSVALLNIYVFNISKDIIQFIIFWIIFEVLSSEKSNNMKIFMTIIILALEAIFFRVYYLIMALLVLTIYMIYKLFIEKKKLEKKNIVKIIILGIILFFIQVLILQSISTENYNSIMYARSSVNVSRLDGIDANTIIIEYFGDNTSFDKFILNYLTVFLRLLFPIELITKGIKYMPFIIYQLLITFNLLNLKKNINKENVTWLIVIASFFMVSAIFEPDFGSFIRHESTMFLIFLHMLMLSSNYKEE